MQLSVASPEFARLWARHTVRQCRASVRTFRHPLVGWLSLHEEVLSLVQDPGQRLIVFSPDPDSPSEAGLRLLARLAADLAREQAREPGQGLAAEAGQGRAGLAGNRSR